MNNIPKAYRKIAKAARKQGWTFGYGSKHAYALSPEGRKVFFSASPSDNRAVRNFEKTMRQYGLRVDKR